MRKQLPHQTNPREHRLEPLITAGRTASIARAMDLPYELLDEVLRRIPPQHLTACRRVCGSWRAVIDGRGLVLAHLAPRPPRGIFINFIGVQNHSFFSRGAAPSSPSIGSSLRFLPAADWWAPFTTRVLDHSNGLLLCENSAGAMHVCNPLTRRWAAVPPLAGSDSRCMHLAFDPKASLHYHVLHFPDAHPEAASYDSAVACPGAEWPPCSYAVQVLSSRTGQWVQREFVREGDAVVAVPDLWSSDQYEPCIWAGLRCHAVYLQGVFYLHCLGGFLIRLSLLQDKYVTIKTPRLNTLLRQSGSASTDAYDEDIVPCGYLRKSEQGVYYTLVHGYKLWVWVLREASEKRPRPEWELKHQADLELSMRRHYHNSLGGDGIGKSWVLEDTLENRGHHGWDSSDEDSIIDVQGERRINKLEGYIKSYRSMDFLCYHPYKEIVFLCSHYNGFAYYLGSYKLESLGALHPSSGGLCQSYSAPTLDSFVYTPCMDDLLPPAHHDP